MADLACLPFQDLWDHQNEAVRSAITELEIADRCKVVMASGTGKTRVGPAIAIARSARTVVFYAPSLALVRQTLPQWRSAPFPSELAYLCVCSDETVANGSDQVVVDKEELEAEFGQAAVTTDSAVVRDFLSRPGFDGVRVIFSTYQSSGVVRDGCPDGFCFDLGIFDEAHRTAGKDGMFSAPLRDQHTPIAKRAFLTATPKRFNYRRRTKDGDARADFSMDDQQVYGVDAYHLPIRQAIDRGLIANYKVIVSVVDNRRIERAVRDGQVQAGDLTLGTEQLAHAIAIRDAINQFGVRKIVTFHNSIAEAEGYASSPAVQQELATPVFHVNGGQSTAERSTILEKFAQSERAVVTNARCLTEGVDVPEIDMVAFLHPKKSRIDIIQAIGRALRLAAGSGKETGYILLPLYVHEIENGQFERGLKEFGYDTIWQVIEALREQDSMVDAQIRQAIGGQATGHPVTLDDILEIVGPGLNLDLLRASISTQCVEVLGESWDAYYALLKRIADETGETNIPRRTVVDGVNLGRWTERQRQSYQTGSLSVERIAKLEAIGIAWNTLDAIWEEYYALLTRIERETGSANVRHDLVVDGCKVGQWVKRQRTQYRLGRLPTDRAQRLEAIGFKWNPLDATWEEHYALLTRIERETGSANVRHDLVVDGVNLGRWTERQRQSYQTGSLSVERIAKLEAIGIAWNTLDATWEEHYALLKRIADETGNANVDRALVVDGLKIWRWVKTQRQRYSEGRLSAQRTAKLEAIGFKWSARSSPNTNSRQQTEPMAAETCEAV